MQDDGAQSASSQKGDLRLETSAAGETIETGPKAGGRVVAFPILLLGLQAEARLKVHHARLELEL